MFNVQCFKDLACAELKVDDLKIQQFNDYCSDAMLCIEIQRQDSTKFDDSGNEIAISVVI